MIGIFVLQEVLNGPGAFKMPPQPDWGDGPASAVYGCGIGVVFFAEEFDEANSQIGTSASAQLAMPAASKKKNSYERLISHINREVSVTSWSAVVA